MPRLLVLGTVLLYGFDDCLEIERLSEALSDVQGGRLPVKLANSRKHNDGDRRQIRVLLELLAELSPVHHRHHQVHQDQAGRSPGVQMIEGLFAVGRPDNRIPLVLEDGGQNASQTIIIFHE